MSFQRHNSPHVGGMIFRNYIEPFNDISANKTADALGVARSSSSRLTNAISDLSPEMAVRLLAVLGGSAESWIRLQENYDLWKARESIDTENLARIDFDSVA